MRFHLKDWFIITAIVVVFTNVLLWYGIKGDRMDSMVVALRWLLSFAGVLATSFVMIMVDYDLSRQKPQQKKGCSCCH